MVEVREVAQLSMVAVLYSIIGGLSFLDVFVLAASFVAVLASIFLLRELYRRYRGRFSDKVSAVFLWMGVSFGISFVGNVVEHAGEFVFTSAFSEMIVVAHILELVGEIVFLFAIWIWWRYVK